MSVSWDSVFVTLEWADSCVQMILAVHSMECEKAVNIPEVWYVSQSVFSNGRAKVAAASISAERIVRENDGAQARHGVREPRLAGVVHVCWTQTIRGHRDPQ